MKELEKELKNLKDAIKVLRAIDDSQINHLLSVLTMRIEEVIETAKLKNK